MTSYRLDLQYQGAFFHGWQFQPNAFTVEQALGEAYQSFLKSPVRVDGSGRTDTGVHARHQVAVLHTSVSIPHTAILKGIQAYLPEGLSVFQAQAVDAGWSPRPAISRQYRYFLWKMTPPPLFYRPFSAWTHYDLNLDAMCEASDHLIGEKDFSSFRGAGCTARHPIRRIERIMVLNRGTHWEFRVTGNAFLRQMVRILVGTLVEVGQGKKVPSQVPDILAARDRREAGLTLPPQGLFLWKIDLPGDPPLQIPPTCWEIPMA
ncbi:MAG: tRNA pseudouridine synthase A [Candidatus Hinthialibacteria bacterium]|jgi:tRNA pseudouridine38-40 synthase|nr:MAG: tRNA pseudouridine synthase A [Candidatus Hinthialibacteria bacterium OLB16]MCK6494635.1 tRNA pseudouridine(38-40) synthase TruA [bacterium]NUP91772.1 tRNA pseudouridine(38-40) synthase TruA [Candidatus Omnitrophota bacterium]